MFAEYPGEASRVGNYRYRQPSPCIPSASIPCFGLFSPRVPNSAPLELDELRQQYHKAVVIPFEEGRKSLDAKYTAALDSAAKAAQQKGSLDEVVALTGEQKRLEDGLPIPATDDDAPEALKKLRAIYHQHCDTLNADHESAKAKLLPAYIAKLQELETTLTKAGRIPDALLVKAHREGLGSGVVPMAPAPTVTATPAATSPATPAPRAKGDDRKAAEWILANFKEHRIFAGNQLVRSAADLPGGRFALTSIAIDGRHYNGVTPLDGAALMENFGGLEELISLSLGSFDNVNDADLAFVATLSDLEKVALRKIPGITDGVINHVMGLSSLRELEIAEAGQFGGTRLGIWKNSPLEELKIFKSNLSDDGVAALSGFKNLRLLMVGGNLAVTDSSLAAIRTLPSLESLLIGGSGITPEGLASVPMPKVTYLACNGLGNRPLKEIATLVANAFPNVSRFQIGYVVQTNEDLASLAHFKKLKALENGGTINENAWPGLLELRDLEKFKHWSTATAISDAALTALAQLKKLKQIDIGPAAPNPAALAAFKEARPDVKITTD